ncbi:hypothetical protein FRACYDRAFT_271017 [Fragilariopsis cylindrus CCMP1102]|uniref:Uncharacterized protein n=1 Tax=Fragilariopsis cylindrus CCMP1102 TaxID=635003 RepID=A0A1E7EYD6_9STRA|nr:hypothetical protein FRACYDRAFT_271017 [Fragilariopsis cylindrus CCMP1102]|eukprot:OEU10932.1 hypothetical protein FRACYDRAFT_271017 [Fragilariopsis cylindrus CCMP1102]
MIHENSCLISNEVLLELCRTSTTLQELALRSMRIDDNMCKTIAEAFDPPNSNHHHRIMAMPTSFHRVGSSNNLHTTEEEDYNDDASIQTNTHSPSFWTSLDLRQNPNIGTIGYNAILASLERNYDLWCSLMVDNESFQSKFNALIELNQANRGTLIRSPSVDKLAIFIDRLNSNNSSSSSSGGGGDSGDPTSLWYFLNIHRNSILHPYVRYMKWKNMILRRRKKEKEDAALSVASAAAVITTSRQQQPQPQQREYNLPPHPQRAAASTTTTIDGSNTGYGSSTSACSPSSDQQSGLTISAVEQHNTTRRTNNAEEEEKEEDRQHQHQQQQPDLKRYKQSSD